MAEQIGARLMKGTQIGSGWIHRSVPVRESVTDGGVCSALHPSQPGEADSRFDGLVVDDEVWCRCSITEANALGVDRGRTGRS